MDKFIRVKRSRTAGCKSFGKHFNYPFVFILSSPKRAFEFRLNVIESKYVAPKYEIARSPLISYRHQLCHEIEGCSALLKCILKS